jgi:hypothetical protein
MSSPISNLLDEQRRLLRERIRAQRELIAEQLGPPPKKANGAYPRSKLMRFLTRRPAVAVTVLAELAALVAGSHHAKAASAVTALSRIARSTSASGSKRSRAERTWF